MAEPATPQRWTMEPPSLVNVSSSSPAIHSSPPTEGMVGSSAPMLLPSSPPVPYTPRRKIQKQQRPYSLQPGAFQYPQSKPQPKSPRQELPLYPPGAKVIEACEEYSLKSVPAFDFVVDRKTGVASVSRRNRRKMTLRQQQALESVLNCDSDSDSDDYSPGGTQFGDALAALARTVAKSRVSRVQKKYSPLPETPKKMHNPKSELWSSPESVSGFRTPSYFRPQQLPTQTPPGALIGETPYATGMTPYLPRS